MPSTFLNPNDKSANGLLIAGNLTFTSTGGRAGVRSIGALASGQKCYFEVLVNSIGSSVAVGVANNSQSLTALPGPTPSYASAVRQDGIYLDQDSANSGATAFTPSIVAGNVICVAFEFAASPKMSFRIENGLWNNSATGDPATSTDVFDAVIAGIGSNKPGQAYALVSVADPSDSVTVRFASTSWGFSAPSGFTQLDGPTIAETVMLGQECW